MWDMLDRNGDSLVITVPAMPMGICVLSLYRPINASFLGKIAVLCHLYTWIHDLSIA